MPGLGHLLLGRWGRALVFFVAVGGLVLTGYCCAATFSRPIPPIFSAHSAFLRMPASGVFYYFSHFFEAAGPDVSALQGITARDSSPQQEW